ncbi:hypothetical protein L3X38_025665 [Prunus dulcis]|uniref:Retroviral polymerase SH3-like domain-containing protein n=1 Tax=Prunus dulcis TaxID=3755 RepID=A0AAD4W402_PRUDU|nr:hypothetical protein L3X38_025665 [Prunus dulcis]
MFRVAKLKLDSTTLRRRSDPKMISCYFIGYCSRSKGFRFYSPNYSTGIVEIGCAKFIEHEENGTENEDFIFKEECDVIVIENAEQNATSMIPLSDIVQLHATDTLRNHQLEPP